MIIPRTCEEYMKEALMRKGCSQEGTIYWDDSLVHQNKNTGKRSLHHHWRAEIEINNVRYRFRAKNKTECEDWLKAVRMGRILPTDNKADWRRMEQYKDLLVRYDEIIVSAAEEALLLYDFHQTGDLTRINEYLTGRLLPHMVWYCCHTLKLGLETSMMYVRQAAGLLLTRITAGQPVPNFTAACKKMLRVRRDHKDFWYYEKEPKEVAMFVNGIDFSHLSQVYKVTKDRRL